MPQLNGIEATQQIVSREPRTRVVILSMHSDEGYTFVLSRWEPAATS
jgi:DNA-binding NarL/FixJ family response regulator